MSRSRVAELSTQQLIVLVGALMGPGIVVMAAMAGAPWQLLDRPILDATIIDDDFVPSVGRGLAVALVVAIVLAVGALLNPRHPGGPRGRARHAMLLGGASLVLVPLTHAFYLAEPIGVERLGNPIERETMSVTLAMMTSSEWSQTAPYLLVSLYAITAASVVLWLVAVHARYGSPPEPSLGRPPRTGGAHNAWSSRG